MEDFLTVDQTLLGLVELSRNFSHSKSALLIQGDIGTGKNFLAQYIHSKSLRSNRPLILLDCSLVPNKMFEVELFGLDSIHFSEKNKSGKFQLAHEATLLLDEISEIDLKSQLKILNFLQTGFIERTTSGFAQALDVRVIATTSQNLKNLVDLNLFNKELLEYFEKNKIYLPPLKDRIGDISYLSKSFLNNFLLKNSKSGLSFSAEALLFLETYHWPGNVTQLKNVIESAANRAQSLVIHPLDLKINFDFNHYLKKSWIPGKTLDDVERGVILDALQFHQGNRTHTARALGISIRTLRNKISDYKRMGFELK